MLIDTYILELVGTTMVGTKIWQTNSVTNKKRIIETKNFEIGGSWSHCYGLNYHEPIIKNKKTVPYTPQEARMEELNEDGNDR